MASIITTALQCYNGNAPTASFAVGILSSSGSPYVARFTFQSGETGSSKVSWTLPGNFFVAGQTGSTRPSLRWYIGTSPTSHINAGASMTTYTGTVTASEAGGAYTFSGSADIVLLPNTTYYLWIFPYSTTYGWYNLTANQQAALEVSGSAGVVRIEDGESWEIFKAVIEDGTDWDSYMPYIDDGTAWHPY